MEPSGQPPLPPPQARLHLLLLKASAVPTAGPALRDGRDRSWPGPAAAAASLRFSQRPERACVHLHTPFQAPQGWSARAGLRLRRAWLRSWAAELTPGCWREGHRVDTPPRGRHRASSLPGPAHEAAAEVSLEGPPWGQGGHGPGQAPSHPPCLSPHRGMRCFTWSYVLIPTAQPGKFSVDQRRRERGRGGGTGTPVGGPTEGP